MRRRLLWHLLRVVLTGAAVAWVFHLIEFEDTVRVGERAVKAPEISGITRSADGTAWIRWADGRETEHPSGEVVRREGFFSLFGRADKGLYLAMVAALLVPAGLFALRWWLILRGHGFVVPISRVFFINYAGLFFNNFLPGGVGGDLTKTLLAVSGQERKAAVAATVILDRLVGLVVLVVMGAACVTPFVGRLDDPAVPILLYGLLGGVLLAYLAYFSRPLRGWLGGRLPFRRTMGELDGVFRSARERKGLMGAAAGLALLSQAATILVIYGLGLSLGIESVPLWMFFVFEPVIFLVTALPISIGGWGVQEGAYQLLFGGVGGLPANEAIALSVCFKLGQILVSIPGGVLYALGATRRA